MKFYLSLFKLSLLSTSFIAIIALVCFVVLKRAVKKYESKRLELLENELNKSLWLMIIGMVLSSVFGLIAIFTR